ncbi:MAG: hypothetical protein H6766_07445 [Candidatus Peribacteria bacterium]|nr:MAG: hypothetical protein H6766_07445 [Candidatus Peribacteria bacterium]
MFVSDWHFASGEPLDPSPHFFPSLDAFSSPSLDTAVQIVGSGPDSSYPSLLHGLLASINTAQEQILITTPYFVPTADFITALVLASHRGVDVKVLLPHKGDSVLLDVANQAYVADLLDADIEVYFYNKGFVHAKTCVIDRMIGIVGTANLDMRSFDLNFEVNAMLYGAPMAQELTDIYLADLADSIRVDRDTWSQRPWWKHFLQQIVRLLAPLL